VYEVGLGRRFRAQHVMPGMEGPEGRPHEHDYRIDVVATRAELDDRGMVCDLDVLERALAEVVARVDGRDLDEIRPPAAEAVTVEVLARWAHGALGALIAGAGVEHVSVRVWESPTAFGGYAAPPPSASS
jgi:6-pyruvoyltetrahydropterin/6-carboxytetrahydropterin synthase